MNISILNRTLLLALGSMALPAMAQTQAAVADVNAVLVRNAAGIEVRVADVLADLARAPEAGRKEILTRPENIQQAAANLLTRRVLGAEAQRDGADRDPVVAASLQLAKDRVLSDARLAAIDKQNKPSDAAIDAYARNMYQADTSPRFARPAQTRARHILLTNSGPESLAKAKELLAQLRAGASFEELAKANSTDPGSAARGGDLGFFGAGKMVRPFEDAVAELKNPGDLSEPVESQFGYHIIRLEERRPAGREPYEAVRVQLFDSARMALLNEGRVQKAMDISKDLTYDTAAIEALSKSGSR